MSDRNFDTVLVISTVHSLYGSFSPEQRFQHTMGCLDSIHAKMPHAKIMFIDNSSSPIPEQYRQQIEARVTVFHQLKHNLFSLLANRQVTTKSESEANMLYTAFGLLAQHDLLGRRIFKISGRYRLSDGFDITEYDNPEMAGKYTFVVSKYSSDNGFNSARTTMWLEQALISFTPDLLPEFTNILHGALSTMRRTGDCIEETLFHYIPHDKIYPIAQAHVEGVKAEGRNIVKH